MRVQYTLPQMQPGGLNNVEVTQTGLRPFKSRLRRLSRKDALNWQQILRVDQSTDSAATIGPPPRPANFEMRDSASERLRWRNLIMQQPPTGDERIQRMFGLFQAHQTMEDRVISRYLAETQG
jgi:hypothetical protein